MTKKKDSEKIKIVTVGGGTGSFEVLSALRKQKESGVDLDISAVVSMSDSGGSTGYLMDDYGVLPPGDVRQCLVALSPESDSIRKLFSYRYEDGFLGGHSFGNIFLSTVEKISGSFYRAVNEAGKILNIQGKVFPVTLSKHNLVVETEGGEKIVGEKIISQKEINISDLRNLKRIYLDQDPGLNPKIEEVFRKADIILINPGSFYTSIMPNFLVNGFVEALKKSPAKKVFVINMVTEKKQTDDFSVLGFLKKMEKQVFFSDFDYVFYNNNLNIGDGDILARYKEEGKYLVKIDRDLKWKKTKFIGDDFLKKPHQSSKNKNFIRYDGNKLVKKVLEI